MSLPPLVPGATPFSPVTVLPPQSTMPVVPTAPSPGDGSGGGRASGGNLPGNSTNTNLISSASVYLYTFLATLILVLIAVGILMLRSFILYKRRRRMVDLAIRNGTYVPSTPYARPARVDLSKIPQLWEVYLRGGGWPQPGGGTKKEIDIGTNWKSEYSRDWESIKPIYAGYTEPLASVPYSGSTPNFTASLSPPVSIPAPTPINSSASRGDDEENRRTAAVSTGTTPMPRPSLLTRAKIFLNPNSTTAPASSSADNGTDFHTNSTNISMTMTELSPSHGSNSPPPKIRVTVLIAMPSPSTSTPLSASLSSKAQPTISSPLKDEKRQLPHLEMGVADVVMGRSNNSSTWDSAHTISHGGGKRRLLFSVEEVVC